MMHERDTRLLLALIALACFPGGALAETEIFNGVRYNKLDIASCKEEAGYEDLQGNDFVEYVVTCLEDFQGMADYENMTRPDGAVSGNGAENP